MVHAPLLPHLLGLAAQAVPLLHLLDLSDLAPAQVPLDALLAEGVRAGVAAEEVAALGAPGAVLVIALLVLCPLAVVVKLATPRK